MVIRVLWMYPGTYVPRLLSKKIRAREDAPAPRAVFIVAWTGMRGVVSLRPPRRCRWTCPVGM